MSYFVKLASNITFFVHRNEQIHGAIQIWKPADKKVEAEVWAMNVKGRSFRLVKLDQFLSLVSVLIIVL